MKSGSGSDAVIHIVHVQGAVVDDPASAAPVVCVRRAQPPAFISVAIGGHSSAVIILRKERVGLPGGQEEEILPVQ